MKETSDLKKYPITSINFNDWALFTRAKDRASKLRLSLSQYVAQLVQRDIENSKGVFEIKERAKPNSTLETPSAPIGSSLDQVNEALKESLQKSPIVEPTGSTSWPGRNVRKK